MILKGRVTKIFSEKESGFKILVIALENKNMLDKEKMNPDFPGSVTVIGMLKVARIGYVIEVDGEWKYTANGEYWPWQFKVNSYSVCEFETPVLLERFLSEIDGIDITLARQMTRHFQNLNHIIEKQPERLCEINGISDSKARNIQRAYFCAKEERSLKSFLKRYKISDDVISEIAAFYGTNVISKIKENPYILFDDDKVSFNLCDKIAKDINFPYDDIRRIKSAMNYVLLKRAGLKGHTYLNEPLLIEETNAFLNENAVMKGSFNKSELEDKLRLLSKENRIVVDSGKYYHPNRFINETNVAEEILKRSKKKSKYYSININTMNECLSKAQAEIGIILDEVQSEAVKTSLLNQISVITGGPGCGKTSLLKVLLRTMELIALKEGDEKPIISLAAPTGMAAKRITESTGREAKTIHKLFDIKYDIFNSGNDNVNINSDIVVLDEVSMLDIDIMACIMRSINLKTMLVLVGDRDQIPSIGPGNVLADIIASGVVATTRLTRSYRHGSRKTILTNAGKINNGEEDLVTNRSDFVLYPVIDKASDGDCRRLSKAVERVFCEEFIANGKDPFKVQVISPLRAKTLASANELNVVLQRIANPGISVNDEINIGNTIFRKGDKVMQVSNNYDKGVYNGDEGIIKLVSKEQKKLLVDYQGHEVEYSKIEFDQLKHSYCITVHKAQGRECPIVIMVVTNFHSAMLIRNLFYTGVTRAKQRMIIIGDEEAVKYAIRNTKGTERFSALCERLKEGMEKL